jgi:MFS family permease
VHGAAEVFRNKLRGVLPSFDRRVWFLLFAMLVFRFGQGLFYPFSTIYFANFVGIPLSLIGVGLASLAVASIVSGLVSGPVTDHFGRKPMMLVALSGSATTFFLFSQVGSFAGYVAVCVMAGLAGSSMFDAARNAMVADVVEPGKRARAYGLVRVGGNVGWAAGPAFAGFAAAFFGSSAATYQYMFMGTSAFTFVVAVSLAFFVGESLPGGTGEPKTPAMRGISDALSHRAFLMLLGAGFLMYYVFTQDWQALPIYSKNFLEMPDFLIGLFLAGNGLLIILLQLPVARMIDERSKSGTLTWAAVLFALSSATLLLTDSFWGVFVAFVGFFTLAEMVLEVAGAAYASEMAPVKLRGTYLALFGVCFGAAHGFSPIVAGSLLQAGMPNVIWAIQIAAASLAAVLLVIMRMRQKP